MARGGLFIVAWGFVRAQPGYLLSGIRLCIETMLCLVIKLHDISNVGQRWQRKLAGKLYVRQTYRPNYSLL